MIDETIIGYMEDEEHNDQETCMMIIWWIRNYHNYLLGGRGFMFLSLLVCWSVFLSLSSPSLWLSPSMPFTLRPLPLPLPVPHHAHAHALSLSISHFIYRYLSLTLSHSPTLSQHGKLRTRNMFVCSLSLNIANRRHFFPRSFFTLELGLNRENVLY